MGTPRYASVNNHLGVRLSRRDDLESIGYVLIYFLKGSLPWQGLKEKEKKKKYRLILEKKQQVSIAQLCKDCPSQFAEFLSYTRTLPYEGKPDIPFLRGLFSDLYEAQGYNQTVNDLYSLCTSRRNDLTCTILLQPYTWEWEAHMSAEDDDYQYVQPVPRGLRPITAGAVTRPNTAATGNGGGLDADDMDNDDDGRKYN